MLDDTSVRAASQHRARCARRGARRPLLGRQRRLAARRAAGRAVLPRIARQTASSSRKTVVSLGEHRDLPRHPGDGGRRGRARAAPLAQPADLLREVHRAQPAARPPPAAVRLDGRDGARVGRQPHARLLRPLLPDAARARRDRLLVDERRTRRRPRCRTPSTPSRSACCASTSAASAWPRPRAATTPCAGTVLHWHQEAGRPVLAPAELAGRVAASLRAVRRTRKLSQHDLGDLAGVTASAISQVERAERGLSLATLVRLSAALGITIDELLRGEDPGVYRIGRRTDDPQDGLEHTVSLLGGRLRPAHRPRPPRPARERRAAQTARPGRASSPSPAASCRCRSRARRPPSATARCWSPTASRSPAGATSARPRPSCSGSSAQCRGGWSFGA